ncbi:hypothetical protein CEXT_434651 [Caerostris extrusa]|uniref:Uncharacterized protein n=1 Tax=Caerostris extrusa TaxID=172846 RepID=A0AAV4XDN3_CAEEX|nr:hypothetical protein CEXT_434651 [Caerostris extrusa]
MHIPVVGSILPSVSYIWKMAIEKPKYKLHPGKFKTKNQNLRKRVRYGGFANRATVAFASLELVQKFRVAISSRKAAAICFSFVLETLQWNEDLGFQIRREFADDNRYEFIALFPSLFHRLEVSNKMEEGLMQRREGCE